MLWRRDAENIEQARLPCGRQPQRAATMADFTARGAPAATDDGSAHAEPIAGDTRRRCCDDGNCTTKVREEPP
jgi:hypothetical protein